MKSHTLFSITIPAYKSSFLQEAIESCLAQSYTNFEIVVVDDASPEDLHSIVASFHDKRIRYYRNTENFGAVNVVDNWNKCLEYSHGDYVICIGDDDCLTPDCLNEYEKLIAKYPSVNVLHAWTEIIDEHSEIKEVTESRPEIESAYAMLYYRWNGRKRQFIGDFCFKTEPLKKEGGFYKLPMAWGSDDISAFRAALNGGIANTQIVCFQYRINSSTISMIGSGKVKIIAVLGEKEWYINFLNKIETSLLPETDQQYFDSIMNQIHSFFSKKILYTCRTDLERNPKNVFFWYRQRGKIGITVLQLVHTFLAAIKRKITHKLRH